LAAPYFFINKRIVGFVAAFDKAGRGVTLVL